MKARALVMLAIREGRAEQGPRARRVRVLVEDDGIEVTRSNGHVVIGVQHLSSPQAESLAELFSASTEATDVLVAAWLAAEQAGLDHPQPEVSP